MRVLICEDDAETARYLSCGLTSEGHTVDLVSNGRDGLIQASSAKYDLLILDRMMPELDGLSVLRALRIAKVDVPVILLTAMASIDDRVEGLRAGADDYLVKPFAFVELLARIEAIKRRPSLAVEQTELVQGELRIDLLTREVTRSGHKISLQPREFVLLRHFMERPGRVQTKTILLEAVWGLHFDPNTSVLETHVSRLRSKIDKPFDRPYLTTLHGVGYVFAPT
ncbi:response regulator transcription factor [Rhodobacter sp. JA431]|uniref:response regulator transcription factor n=1 Tax=Rhodobacter sp. JA431 TaxID=570013 RepID=UPI000BE39803|nr:response regulator transcription factor [Rhodobacter sp. JA431]